MRVPDPSALDSVRLDVWLDVACLFPTRSQARLACEGGKVDVNGSRAKPHRAIRAGDRISLATSRGERRELLVLALADRSIRRSEARRLYEDRTPPPSAEVVEARRLDRMLMPRQEAGRPDKRERRERRKQKGW
ncbi:MAG: RNA-binding S4 domain-containing protein [Thermoanaerobaculia bacterium]